IVVTIWKLRNEIDDLLPLCRQDRSSPCNCLSSTTCIMRLTCRDTTCCSVLSKDRLKKPSDRPPGPGPQHARRPAYYRCTSSSGAQWAARCQRSGRSSRPMRSPAQLRGRCRFTGSERSVVEAADMALRVQFDADLADQIDLGFEEIDVTFLVLHQILEQILADVVLDLAAVGRRLF